MEKEKRRMTKKKKAKIKAMVGIGLAVVGAIIVIAGIAFGVSRFISYKANKIVSEKMNTELEVRQEKTVEEEVSEPVEEAVVEEPVVETLTEEDDVIPDSEEELPEDYEEAEEEPATVEVVAIDTARIRSTPSTDGEILGKTKVGDKFTRLSETDDGWSQIKFNDGEAYIKSEYLDIYTGEDNTEAAEDENAMSAEEEAAKAVEDAKKAADELAQAAATAQAAQDTAAQTANQDTAAQQAAPAPAPAPAAGGAHVVSTSDGQTMTVNDAQYAVFQKYWGYLGTLDETISHHTKGDLIALLTNEGVY